MKRRTLFVLIAIMAIGLLATSTAFGIEIVSPDDPSKKAEQSDVPNRMAAENRSGGGIGLELGAVEADVFVTDIEFTGFSLFYKQGFTDRWGLLATYRDLEDDEGLLSGESYAYTQFAVHGVYMWRVGKRVRPHVKFGLAYTDFEFKIPGLFSGSDDGTDMSIGGGLEAGSEKVAFFGDFDYSEPTIDFPDASPDLEIANLTIGVIFKY